MPLIRALLTTTKLAKLVEVKVEVAAAPFSSCMRYRKGCERVLSLLVYDSDWRL